MKTKNFLTGVVLLASVLSIGELSAQSKEVKQNAITPSSELIAESYDAEYYYFYNKNSGKGRVGGVTANSDGPAIFSNGGYDLHFGLSGTEYDYLINMARGRNGDPSIYSDKSQWFRIGAKGGLAFWGNGKYRDDDSPALVVTSEGNVGIGSTNPKEKLEVSTSSGSWGLYHKTPSVGLGSYASGSAGMFGTYTNHNLMLFANNSNAPQLVLTPAGKIGIGNQVNNVSSANLSNYNLFVSNGVLSEKYGLGAQSTWSDHVFEKQYHLRPLTEIKRFVDQYGHLPNIPSAEDIAKDGYSLHEMNVKFLEKIEELTLYSIQQEEEIERLKTDIAKYQSLAEKVAALELLLKEK